MKLRSFALDTCFLLYLSAMGSTPHALADENASRARGQFPPEAFRTLLVSELFEEEILAENVFAIRHHEVTLTEIDRFEYLANWVLPSETHATIRMSGAFTPTDPAPIVPPEYLDATGSGGTLVSPAFDLLDLAVKLGRLEELRERVASIPEPAMESQQRAHAAIRILLALELNEESAIESDVKKLQHLVTSAVPTSVADQWPETLVGFRSVTKFPQSSACDIVDDLVSHRMQRGIPAESAEWHSQIFSLAGRHRTQQINGTGSDGTIARLEILGMCGWLAEGPEGTV